MIIQEYIQQYQLLITFIIIIAGIVMFVRETWSVDTIAIIIMTMFIISGILTPNEGFAGFINSATITVACMFVLSYGLFKSGILNPLITILIRAGEKHYLFSLVLIMIIAATLSAFINDTAVVALLMPVVIRMSERTGESPGRYLMPLSFAALLGGICTILGTSTNVLVSGIVQQYGLEPLGMFEFAKAGFWITVSGITFMLVVGPIMLPKNSRDGGITRRHKIPRYIARVRVMKGNNDIGKDISQAETFKKYNAELLRIDRLSEKFSSPFNSEVIIREGDELKMLINSDELLLIRKDSGFKLLPEFMKMTTDENEKTYKVVVPHDAPFANQPYFKLQSAYDFDLLAWKKTDRLLGSENILNEKVKEGEILLIATDERNMYKMVNDDQLMQLKEYSDVPKVDYYKAIISVLILAGVMTSAALGWADIVISAMVGSLLLIVLGLVKPEEAYEAIEWKVIFMLAGVLSMGAALEKTGGSGFIAQGIQFATGDFSPHVTLAVLFMFTMISTNFLSNNATAALIAPIAIKLAQLMELSERPFVIAIMFAASLSFITPMGYQTNTMIYTPGNYKFSDYTKIGIPLSIILCIVAMIVIPMYFPFTKT
ncbi:MAG TPA: SLC13 family permease [Chitinophagales bacterium]|nr:SLC13 family permease [Chitinophagales bacterium]